MTPVFQRSHKHKHEPAEAQDSPKPDESRSSAFKNPLSSDPMALSATLKE
jgi:hypothetical protein